MAADDFDPPLGTPVQVGDGLRRIVAPNPGPMTHRGTNTYLLGGRAIAVIDPGPDDADHLAAIRAACAGREITHILITHAHRDHSALAPRLAAATGAPVMAYGPAAAGRPDLPRGVALPEAGGGEGVDTAFAPDVALSDGAELAGPDWQLTALWTPGHMGNHMCFAGADGVFTGDLVMGWSSSMISPPDGDVAAFRDSCRRLRTRGPARLWPGHGPPVADPTARIDALLAHRAMREAQILAALADGPATAAELALRVYPDATPGLAHAATRTALAHLVDLVARGRVKARPAGPKGPVFALTRVSKNPAPPLDDPDPTC